MVKKPFPELPEIETDILEWLAQGYSNPTITNKLSLSVKTVQNNVSNILSKLQVVDRTEAIIRAREKGLGKIKQTAGLKTNTPADPKQAYLF